MESNLVSTLWNMHNENHERYITCVHSAFLEAAILAQQYVAAEQHISAGWPTLDHMTGSAKDVLRYYYLRGIVHMGCRNWILAMRCFYVCLCFPSKTFVSTMTVAAYKKYVLLVCLCRGDCASFAVTDLELPENTCLPLVRLVGDASNSNNHNNRSSSSSSYYHQQQQKRGYSNPPGRNVAAPAAAAAASEHVVELMDHHRDANEVVATATAFGGAGGGGGGGGASTNNPNILPPTLLENLNAYKTLTVAFANVDRPAFDELLRSPHGTTVFREDGNAGLVDRVNDILLRRQLYVIGGVFSTLSIRQLADEWGWPGSLEQIPPYLQHIRDDKQWPVTIDAADGYVVFPRHPPRLDSTAVMAHTHAEVAYMRQLLLGANEAKLQQLGSSSNKGEQKSSHHFNNNNNKGPARGRQSGGGGGAARHQQQSGGVEFDV
jgi:uncharacterized membrane protein YgcG